MVAIRDYREDDPRAVGRLIADTYSEFNLSCAPAEEVGLFLRPFQHARSGERSHQEAIAQTITASIVCAAEDGGEVVGVRRGRKDRLQGLSVRGDHHRQGMGRRLAERFEEERVRQGGTVIRVAATLDAVPFYLALAYKRSTRVRTGWSFEGRGLRVQPMRKVLRRAQADAPRASARLHSPRGAPK